MKKVFLISLLLTIISVFPVFAGEWIQESDGKWRYQNNDGTYPHSGWCRKDKCHYYFDENGYLLTDTITPDGNTVNSDGVAVEGPMAEKIGYAEFVAYTEMVGSVIAQNWQNDDIESMNTDSNMNAYGDEEGNILYSTEQIAASIEGVSDDVLLTICNNISNANRNLYFALNMATISNRYTSTKNRWNTTVKSYGYMHNVYSQLLEASSLCEQYGLNDFKNVIDYTIDSIPTNLAGGNMTELEALEHIKNYLFALKESSERILITNQYAKQVADIRILNLDIP